MTDRELLEFAAKAAEYGIDWDEENKCFWGYFPSDIRDVDFPWDPLTDDGDALRLAVKLHIGLLIESWEVAAYAYNVAECREPSINGDTLSATRRAIVRAAAEIGKAMQS